MLYNLRRFFSRDIFTAMMLRLFEENQLHSLFYTNQTILIKISRICIEN